MLALILSAVFQVAPTQEETAPRIELVERPLAEFDRLAAAQKWGDLRALIGALEPVDRYVKRGERWVGLRAELRRRVDALPEEGRRAVRGEMEDRAAALWRAWTTEGDPARLREIERTCLESKIAPTAIELLGNLAMDGGDVEEAVACWSRLAPSAAVIAKLALAWSCAGREDEVARLADVAAGMKDEIVVAGRNVKAGAYVASLLRPAAKPAGGDPVAKRDRFDSNFDVLQMAPLRSGIAVLALPDRVVAVRGDGVTAWTVIDGAGAVARMGPLGSDWDGTRVFATRFGAGRRVSVLSAMKMTDGSALWSIDEPAWRKALGVKGEPALSTPVLARGVVCIAINVRDPSETDIACVAGLDPAVFAWVLARRAGAKTAALQPFDPVAVRYVDAIERLAGYVDQVRSDG